ncbi:ABC-three component system middle component 1 [Paraburkholderia phymatum]|uniref:ABC-three component system middle component 1 n=2 Tax=Paraburkholderia phymatum TaxID=148447 RepID=A0ACC6U9W8_9BURK
MKFITCFVAIFSSGESCVELWEKVNSSVTVVSQSFINSGVMPWNLYLLMCSPDSLNKLSKYRIENDRFAARKIIVSDQELPQFANDPYRAALEDAILGNDIELTNLEASENVEARSVNHDNFIRTFLLSKNEPVPVDRKPASIQLRKQYLSELMGIAKKT